MIGKELEKILKNNLHDYFKVRNYKYSHKYANTFFTNKDNSFSIKLEVQSDSRSIGYADFTITFWDIEDIILEIGQPQVSQERMREAYPDFTSIHDKNLLSLLKFDKLNPIETENECIQYCQRIIEYMEKEGKAFIGKFSYLPNVLVEMDRLEKEGKYWNEILSGHANSRFRGIIISKLCNDPNFNKKIDVLDQIFATVQLLIDHGWVPYYEKLKERLKTLEPLYNI